MSGSVHIIDATPWSGPVAQDLRGAGFVVLRAFDRESGERLLRRRPPDHVIVVDAPPVLDALDALVWLCDVTAAPLTVATACVDEQRCLAAFAAGADDVIPWDCPAPLLIARLRAVLRRAGECAPARTGPIAIGDVRVEPDAHRVSVRGHSVHLTPLEFSLLHTLMRDPGVVYTREDLLDSVWGSRDIVVQRTIDAHVWKLRRKMEANGVQVQHIVSVPHLGYRFRRPDEVGLAGHTLAG